MFQNLEKSMTFERQHFWFVYLFNHLVTAMMSQRILVCILTKRIVTRNVRTRSLGALSLLEGDNAYKADYDINTLYNIPLQSWN